MADININPDIDPQIQALRDATQELADSQIAQIDQAKINAYDTITNKANAAGMLYSTFPERMKIQYLGSTYTPAVQKVYQNYQTNMGNINTNAAKILSTINAYNKAINEYNAS